MFEDSIAKVEQYLSLRQGPLVLGVSGGPDSLALLHLMASSSRQVVIAHLNHGLRTSSAADYQYVQGLADRSGVEFFGRHVQAARHAEQEGQTLEQASRELRYQFLFEVAKETQAAGVVVGHTADDQVETVLMHFLRGAGTAGLLGMQFFSLPNPWHAEIPLIRPLLGHWRMEIETYCRLNQLEPRLDESNMDPHFTRNRLRMQLIPELESYNPQVKAAILRTSQIQQAEFELLQPIFDRAWAEAVRSETAVYIQLNRPVLEHAPQAVRRVLIQRALQALAPALRQIHFDWIERADELLQRDRGAGTLELGAGLVVYAGRSQVWFFHHDDRESLGGFPLLNAGEIVQLPIPGVMPLGERWRLQSSRVVHQQVQMEEIFHNQDPYQCWLQFPEPVERLVIRGRQPGERFRPLGMEGHSMKLSDYMTNVRIPEPFRDRWPLVVIDQETAWVAGHAIAHPFRVTEKISPIVHLELKAETPERGE